MGKKNQEQKEMKRKVQKTPVFCKEKENAGKHAGILNLRNIQQISNKAKEKKDIKAPSEDTGKESRGSKGVAPSEETPFQVSEASRQRVTPVLKPTEKASEIRTENLEDSLQDVPLEQRRKENEKKETKYAPLHYNTQERKYLINEREETGSFEERKAVSLREAVVPRNMHPIADPFAKQEKPVHLVEQHHFGRFEETIKYEARERKTEKLHPLGAGFPDKNGEKEIRKYRITA